MEKKFNVIVRDGGNNSRLQGVLHFDAEKWPEEKSATLELGGPINGTSLRLTSETKRFKMDWVVKRSDGKKCHSNHNHSVEVISYTVTSKK